MMMRKFLHVTLAAGLCLAALAAHAQSQASCSFSLYRLSSSQNDVTEPFGVNDFNNSVGQFTTEPSPGNFVRRGFIHLSSGAVSLFTAPHSTATSLSDRNDAGTMVGSYFDTITNKPEGFVLHNGTFVTVNHPNAPRGTALTRINKNSVIVGSWFDSNGVSHGFKLVNGGFTSIHFPNSVNTSPQGINDNGAIVGWYTTSTTGFQGFTFINGTYRTLNVLNAPTELRGISNAGTIVGLSHSNEAGVSFLRKSSGAVELISVPNAASTDVTGISLVNGIITGRAFFNSDGTWHGFTAKCQ
jgi:hypothetical protein